MTNLQRITTEYSLAEDRVRLAGEAEDGATVSIWLTRRLLERLVPVLVQWLEGQGVQPAQRPHANNPRNEVLQSFAQQAARAELTAQPAVKVVETSLTWLAQTVDVRSTTQLMVLTFKSGNGEQAGLRMQSQALRQWLDIVHGAYVKAEWPMSAWPAWLLESKSVQASGGPMVVH